MGQKSHLFVQDEPRGEAFIVHELQTEVPYFPEADGTHHLVKQLLASGRGLDGELQLRVHGGNAYADL